MANKFVIFPASEYAAAQAYKAFGDAWANGISGEENGQLGEQQIDAWGQHVTTYAGPPYVYSYERGEEPEPVDGPAMRAKGVISDNWTPPPEQDD